jgi:hypothetical protein
MISITADAFAVIFSTLKKLRSRRAGTARTISSRSIDALSIGSMRNAALARATAT